MFQIPEILLIIFNFVSEDDPSLSVPLMFVNKLWRDLIHQFTDVKFLWLPQFSFVCDNEVDDFLSKDSNQLATQDLLTLFNSLVSGGIDSSLFSKIMEKLNGIDKPIRFFVLGRIYYKGLCGLQNDAAKALLLWEEGSKLDDPRSTEELLVHMFLADKELENDYDNIEKLAKKCIKIDKSRSNVLNVLGLIHKKRKNYSKALKYFKIASSLGDCCGRTHFANMMYTDMKLDNKLVYYLFKSATMGPNNLLINFVNFGLYHYNKSNFAEAEKLFEIGYKMGCYDCCYMVGIICKNLEKFEKAFEHFKLASENGIKDASINLAHCYLEGIGVEKNFNKGVELLLQNNLNE